MSCCRRWVTALSEVFDARQVALFLPARGPASNRMELAASAGEPLSDAQLRTVLPAPGAAASMGGHPADRDGLTVIALAAAGGGPARLVGLVARHEREPLLLFANHIALAVERAQLRDQALRPR